MTVDIGLLERLRALVRIVGKELKYLQQTDARLFVQPFTVELADSLESDQLLGERIDAFVGRFGRLQDTLGDKLLPNLLSLLKEPPRAFIDTLDRAERLGWINSADAWVNARQLRNRMVHEYMESPARFVDAINAAHEFVPMLASATQAMTLEVHSRIGAGK